MMKKAQRRGDTSLCSFCIRKQEMVRFLSEPVQENGGLTMIRLDRVYQVALEHFNMKLAGGERGLSRGVNWGIRLRPKTTSAFLSEMNWSSSQAYTFPMMKICSALRRRFTGQDRRVLSSIRAVRFSGYRGRFWSTRTGMTSRFLRCRGKSIWRNSTTRSAA